MLASALRPQTSFRSRQDHLLATVDGLPDGQEKTRGCFNVRNALPSPFLHAIRYRMNDICFMTMVSMTKLFLGLLFYKLVRQLLEISKIRKNIPLVNIEDLSNPLKSMSLGREGD